MFLNLSKTPFTFFVILVAEQKHCQLLNITRTLIFEINVPSYMWFDETNVYGH